MTAPDPLADVLLDAWDGRTLRESWPTLARAAREYIAGEIEADRDTSDEYTSGEAAALTWAARIARGGA